MKLPYYNLTATCSDHGQFTVQRKSNPRAGQRCESGGVHPPHSLAIVCSHPGCGYQFKVTNAELITDQRL